MAKGTRDLAADLGLFVALVGLATAWVLSPRDPLFTGAFFVALLIHAWFSIYAGRLEGWRKLTWLALVACTIGEMLAALPPLLVPWGQIAFWLAATLNGIPLIGETLALALQQPPSSLEDAFRLLPTVALGADIAVMLAQRWRHTAIPAVGLVAAVIVATALLQGATFLIWPGSGAEIPAQDDFRILPEWYLLPAYAILRAVPDKLAGVLATLAALLVPAILPWARMHVIRDRRPLAWLSLCLALAATWLGLGTLGSQAPEESVILASQILTAAYFGYFLVLPLVARRLSAPTPCA